LARQGGNTRAYDLPRPRLRRVGEGAPPCVYSHGPIVGLRKGLEVGMNLQEIDQQYSAAIGRMSGDLEAAYDQIRGMTLWSQGGCIPIV
jgi:hypothetical protein